MGKKSAFSLAETLLALGTISVVLTLIISSLVGASKSPKVFAAQFDKIFTDLTNVSKIILYEDCLYGEKFSSFTPIELRDSFASRMHINGTWDKGKPLRENSDGTLSVLDVQKKDVPGITLSNGAHIGFIEADAISCETKTTTVKKEKPKEMSFFQWLLWLLGLGYSGTSTVVYVEETERDATKCLMKNSVTVDTSRLLTGVMLLDVNGTSSPNKFHADQFVIPLYDDGI